MKPLPTAGDAVAGRDATRLDLDIDIAVLDYSRDQALLDLLLAARRGVPIPVEEVARAIAPYHHIAAQLADSGAQGWPVFVAYDLDTREPAVRGTITLVIEGVTLTLGP